jgi:glycosyltransferase involved in cell wall biosynthesis
MKRVAIVGIQGVPAQYGGFESLVENIIGDYQSKEVEYTVFCSGKDYAVRLKEYKGVKLQYIERWRANGAQSTLYDITGMLRSLRGGYDTVLILGVSGCVFLPVFRALFRGRLVVNIDGQEYMRAKWKGWQRSFLRWSERLAVRCADVVIADNKGILDYVRETYGREASLVAYGGDQVLRVVAEEDQLLTLRHYGLERYCYGICVCRIEPENNCHVTLEAFAATGRPLVFIGNWNHSVYGRSLKVKYRDYKFLKLLNPVYDLDVLYTLRLNARYYVHGHSAGGTNPSLVEAMFFGRPIFSFDVVYNRETTLNRALYFKTCEELQGLIEAPLTDGAELRRVAEERYTWKRIAREYEALY